MRSARLATVGFIILLLLSVVSSLSDLLLFGMAGRHQEEARSQALVMAEIERLRLLLERQFAATSAYALTRENEYLSRVSSLHPEFDSLLAGLRATTTTPEGLKLLGAIERMKAEHQRSYAQIYDGLPDSLAGISDVELVQAMAAGREAFDPLIDELARRKLSRVQSENALAETYSARAAWIAFAASVVLLFAGIGLAFYLSRVIRERERAERQLFQETVKDSRDTQDLIRRLREEGDALRRQLAELRSNEG